MTNQKALALLFGDKGKTLCEKLFAFHHRFPQLLPKSFLQSTPLFLSHCPDILLEQHPSSLLIRIFLSFDYLKARQKQRINLRILRISPEICGLTIRISSIQENEIFNDKHIFKGVQNLIPGTVPLPHSYFHFTHQSSSFYYLEIKKMRGGAFSAEEMKKLHHHLPEIFSQEIKPLDHSLIFPGNEEEIFKNIRHLSYEIKKSHDLPQVMISFVEYFKERLKFLVIILRVKKPSTPSILELAKQLPSFVQFSLENTLLTGMIRKKYPKEAIVFTLETGISFFSRNYHAVDLRAARHYIVKAIETMLGPFRDYNGGLLHQENEQIATIKEALELKGITPPSYLEQVFYNIKPISCRFLLTIETGIEISKALDGILKMALKKNKEYLLKTYRLANGGIAILKTKEKKWKNVISQRLTESVPQMGYTFIEREDYFYLCFFLQYENGNLLFESLEQILKEMPLTSIEREKTLQLNFQGGSPSSLNPRLASDIQSHTLSNLLFEGLTRFHEGKIIPAAAAKIEISPCETIYTFHLRKTYWSTGEELTAYHFEKTWKGALMEHTFLGNFFDFFASILHVHEARQKKVPLDAVGIEAKSSKILQVTLEQPCPYFLHLISTPAFYPMLDHAGEPNAFNGPFTLENWNAQESIHLSQNPFWWNAHALKLGGIHISNERDPLKIHTLFQNGELDMIGDPISPLSPEILKWPEVQSQLTHKPISRIFWIHCNIHSHPLDNRNLRKALNHSLDRKKLAEKVFIDQSPHCSPLPPRYSISKNRNDNSIEQAQHYFEMALQELNMDRTTFPPLRMIHSDLSFEEPLIAELQHQWKEALGIQIIPQKLSWNDFASTLEKGNFQLGGLYRRDLFNHPIFYLSFFISSPQNPHSLNHQGFENLYHSFLQGEKPREQLKQLEEILIEESPVIPLVSQRFQALISSRIKGLTWDENGCLNVLDVQINKNKEYSPP